jgi:hypothetical protein
MNCCNYCFESSYLNTIIKKNNLIGNCDYCNSKDINIYPVTELNLFFKGIVDLYEVDLIHGESIDSQILIDFKNKVFSSRIIESKNCKKILIDILNDDIDYYQNLLNQPVKLKLYNYNSEDPESMTITWKKFTDEIKYINRFHLTNYLNLENLSTLFKNFEKELPKGSFFYRARISSNSKGFEIKNMGNPPSEVTKGGRANPNGISYLYLSKDMKTTLYEVRASLYDYVSIGTFELKKNIKVINLSRNTYDVFRLAELESLEGVMIHGLFIDKLEQELSQPRRRSDSELDYLPTQYISEFIKSIGYDGIEFVSSLEKDGVNITVFNPEHFECKDVNVYDVVNMSLDFENVVS